MDFDVIIPISEEDVFHLGRTLPYIKKFIDCNRIVVLGSKKVEKALPNDEQLTFIDENQLIDGLSFTHLKEQITARYYKAGRRTGWYFQQFLKLGYARCSETPYYLSWDVDTLPLGRQRFFNSDGKPYFDVLPFVNQDMAYNQTLINLWPFDGICMNKKRSFIVEHMMFSRQIVNEMLDNIEAVVPGKLFSEIILDAVPKTNLNLSGFSEFETYAAYVRNKHPDVYLLRDWHNLRHGKVFFGDHPTALQLKKATAYFKAISFEDFDHQWQICKCFCSDSSKIDFYSFYMKLKPLIDFYYAFRMQMRKMIRG